MPTQTALSAGDLVQPFQGLQQVSFQFWLKPVLSAADGSYFCPGVDGPTYANNAWDKLFVAVPFNPPLEQPYTPGICTVTAGRKVDKDVKKSYGSDGARLTTAGVPLSECIIEIQIWTPEQLRRLASLWSVLFPFAGKGTPVPYDVQHPELSIHNVRALQFIDGSGPVIGRDRIGRFTMRAIEFLPTKSNNAAKTSTAAIGSVIDQQTTTYSTPGSNPANTGP